VSAQLTSSPPFPLPGVTPPTVDVATHATPCHTSFSLSQDEFTASTSSSSNASSHRLPSQAKTEVLNPHHRRRSPSTDRLTPTLHCYKMIISTLATLSTTQPRLHFTSSLARAPQHRSSIRHHRSLSSLSHTHHPFAQRYPRWWTNRSSFASWTVYQYVNSLKKDILKSRSIMEGYKLVTYINDNISKFRDKFKHCNLKIVDQFKICVWTSFTESLCFNVVFLSK
jgi:hypothetical protein